MKKIFLTLFLLIVFISCGNSQNTECEKISNLYLIHINALVAEIQILENELQELQEDGVDIQGASGIEIIIPSDSKTLIIRGGKLVSGGKMIVSSDIIIKETNTLKNKLSNLHNDCSPKRLQEVTDTMKVLLEKIEKYK